MVGEVVRTSEGVHGRAPIRTSSFLNEGSFPSRLGEVGGLVLIDCMTAWGETCPRGGASGVSSGVDTCRRAAQQLQYHGSWEQGKSATPKLGAQWNRSYRLRR